MTQYLSEMTSVSSKGQIVLPKAIRNSLNLIPGSKLMVFSDGNNILMKPVIQPDISEFQQMMDDAQKWAEEVGLTEDDITDAIRTVRNRRNMKYLKGTGLLVRQGSNKSGK